MSATNDHVTQQEQLIIEANRLLELLNVINECVGQVRRAANDSPMGDGQFDESNHELARLLQDEQAQLIRAWEALEAEQRQLATTNPQPLEQPASPQRVGHNERLTESTSTTTINQVQQFRLLSRECDRKRQK